MKAHHIGWQNPLNRFQLIARWSLSLMLIGGVLAGVFAGLEAWNHLLNYSPFDHRWALLYLAVFVSIGLLCWSWRGRLLILTTVFGVVGFIVLNMTAAHTIGAWFTLPWIMMVSAGLGDKTLRSLVRSIRMSTLERLILAIAVGLGELALLTLAMGLFHVLHRELGYVILGGLTILFVPAMVRFSWELVRLPGELRRIWQESDLRVFSVGLSLLGICLLGALVWAVAPSIHYDALNYHLGVPAIYVQHHAIVEVPEEFRSYWAHNAEMLYTMALVLTGQPLPTLIHLIFGLLTVGLVFSLGKRLASTRVGLMAAVLFYSMPIVTWESGVAYIDLIVTLYTFGAVYAVIVWWLEQDDAWLTLAGLLAGFGLGTKLNAILVLLPFSLSLIFALVLRYGASRRSLDGVLRFGLPALLLVAPWLLRDWVWTGNPIFPFYNAFFQSPKWGHENTFFNFSMFGKGHGIFDLLRLPWDLSVKSSAFMEAARPGFVGGLPLMALPWLYLWHSTALRRLLAMMLALVLGVIVLWFWIGQYLRYLLPLFPLLAVLAALNIEELWLRLLRYGWWRQVVPFALVITLLYVGATRVVDTIASWQIPERYPYRVAFGLETPGAFLSRAMPVYDALQFLNNQGEGKHKVLSIGNEFRMYTTAQISSVHGSREAGLFAASLPPGANLAQALDRQGYHFLLINQNEIRARPGMYQLAALDESFLQQFTRLEFARRNVYVHRVLHHGSESSSVKVENLLSNTGFEQADTHGNLNGWFAYGSGRIDQTGALSHSGKVAVQASGEAGFFQRVAVSPGRLYTLGHWIRADQPGQFARLQVNWLDGSLKIVDVSIDVVPTSAAWQWHQMSVTAPSSASLAQVYVSVHGDSKVWFDDLNFQESR